MAARGEPYLSLVVAARNDDHGGNMLARMQGMLDSWIGPAERCGLPSEIVVVEWNPPADRPRLKDLLRWPLQPEYCQVRFIEVPAEVHARFKNAAAIPLHQMIAKNVGIRRAHGEFVLATNLDIIFSAQLMRFLAERRLETDVMYRIDRRDVAQAVSRYASLDELLSLCETNMLRVFAREGEFQLSANGERALDKQDIVAEDAGVRFGAGWSSVENSDGERYRWAEPEAELFLERPALASAALRVILEAGPSAGANPVHLKISDQSGTPIVSAAITGRCTLRLTLPEQFSSARLRLSVQGSNLPLTRNPRIVNLRLLHLEWEPRQRSTVPADQHWRLDVLHTCPGFDWAASFDAPSPFAQDLRNAAYLHTNACGDFTLLSRQDWFSLRAYPEFPIWPMHIDALLCYAAHHAGVRECILRDPMRIYHVEHSSGAGWTPEGEAERVARIRSKGLSELSYPAFVKWVDLMRRYDSPLVFNGDNWGLGDAVLTEETVWHE